MLAQIPWLRVTLFVVLAAIILLAVGALAFNLGTQNAVGFNPRTAQIDRPDVNGPGQSGQGGRSDQNQGGPGAFSGNQPQTFARSSYLGNVRYSSPLFWLLRGLVGLAFLAMLVLGTIAFFRTNRMQAAGAPVVVDSPEKTAKKSK